MLMYPHIDPVALSFGPIKLHWYGVMYLLGFLFFLYGGKWRIGKFGHPVLTQKMIDDFNEYMRLVCSQTDKKKINEQRYE